MFNIIQSPQQQTSSNITKLPCFIKRLTFICDRQLVKQGATCNFASPKQLAFSQLFLNSARQTNADVPWRWFCRPAGAAATHSRRHELWRRPGHGQLHLNGFPAGGGACSGAAGGASSGAGGGAGSGARPLR